MLSSHPNFSLSLSLSLCLCLSLFLFSFSFFSGKRTLLLPLHHHPSSLVSFAFWVLQQQKHHASFLLFLEVKFSSSSLLLSFQGLFLWWGWVGLGWGGEGVVGFGGSGTWVISDYQQFVAVLFSLLWWDLGCLSFD